MESTQYPLQSGDILIIRAAEAHRLSLQPDQPYERIAIHFSPSVLTPFDPGQRLLRPFLDRPLGQLNHYPTQQDCCSHLQAAFDRFTSNRIPDARMNLLARLRLF